MPRHCSVYGCQSNYKKEDGNISTFSLPKNPDLRAIWIRRIPTDLSHLKNPVVCIKHFEESSIIRTDVINYKGELKEYPRERPKLCETAVPCIFQNTPSYLSKRSSGVKRLGDVEDENLQKAVKQSLVDNVAYINKNKISTLDDVVSHLKDKLVFGNNWTFVKNASKIVLCFMNIETDRPTINGYIVIFSNLCFDVYLDNIKVLCKILPFASKYLTSKNLLDEVITFVEKKETVPVTESKIDFAIRILKSLSEFEESDNLKFIIEQLFLFQMTKQSRRYSNQTMVLASCLYVHSPSAYNALLKCGLMYLPHPRNLRKLICNFQLSNSALDSSVNYLISRVKHLEKHELLVCLLMDEIYIQPQLTFKAGNVYGCSSSDPTEKAKTAQVFMISSLLSKYRDVVTIVPVTNLTSDQLKSMITSLIPILENIGFKIIAIVSDNNAVNRKTFELFTENKILKPFIPHPLDSSSNLFFIFDTVHILKCIRNNWETKKNKNRTLKYPAMGNPDSILSAQYWHLELMYEKEKLSLVKYGHTLSYKALYPSSIQKQNVGLTLKIFNENNSVALKHVARQHADDFLNVHETCTFIDLIVQWWKIVNVKSAFEGKRFNDPFREAIKTENDMQVQFLKDLCLWLKNWRLTVPISDSLSSQTFQALILTTESFLLLVPYLFEKYKFNYILLSKFQSDSLESRFSSYRQLSGANYYISYVQLLENERKIRFKNAVLYSAQHMHISLKTLFPVEQSCDSDVNIEFFAELFDSDFEFETVPSGIIPVLTYIGGFAVRKVLRNERCDVCSSWLVLAKEVVVDVSYKFIQDLDRGKLVLPTEDVVYTVALVWSVMFEIAEKYLEIFLESDQQVSILHKMCVIKLNRAENIALQDECVCKRTVLDKLTSVALIACKILINNVVKQKNELLQESKSNARKVKKLNFGK